MKWWPKASMRLADTVGWYYRRVLLGTIICSDFAGLAAEVFSRRQRQCDQARAAAGSGARVPGANRRRLSPGPNGEAETGPAPVGTFSLALPADARIYPRVDALARAYGPWWLCNDVTRPFWQSGRPPWGRSREGGRYGCNPDAGPSRPALTPTLRGTRQRGRGGRVTDPSSLS